MESIAAAPAEGTAWAASRTEVFVRRRATVIGLSAALFLALCVRLVDLPAYSFSEDEVAKLLAIDAYRRGEFSANAEHPMLMKLAVWASLGLADAWNAHAPPALTLDQEVALRLPNALAGTATVAVFHGVSALFFGPAVAAAGAFVLALDPNIAAINRIGKEDTFLMLFFMLAVFFYERAKRTGTVDPVRAQPWYLLSGVSWGLMLASKYIPHLFGLYALYNFVVDRRPGPNRPHPLRYNGLIVAAFVVANFAIVLPSTWAYCLSYMRGEHSSHHGYLYDGHLYINVASELLGGVPVTYYFHMFATKLPLAVLAGAVVGTVLLFTKRRERGFIWMRVFLLVPIIGYSALGAKFQRYALPMMIVVDMLAAVGLVTAARWLWQRPWPGRVRAATAAAGTAIVAISLAAAPLRVSPFYSVYQNAIGSALAPPVVTFPEEAYDFAVREAVREIVAEAQPRAAIVSDAPLVVEHYVRRSDRRDIEVRSLSQQGLRLTGEEWVLVQDSHMYFENATLVAQLRMSLRPRREYQLAGTAVLHVFHLAR
jgi:hypothetical protein